MATPSKGDRILHATLLLGVRRKLNVPRGWEKGVRRWGQGRMELVLADGDADQPADPDWRRERRPRVGLGGAAWMGRGRLP